MKGLETGKDKVKKICDVLRRETLEPAKLEAEEIIEVARIQADEIIQTAKKEAEKFRQEVERDIERQKNLFQASMNQACKQTLETLRQNIEEKLFNEELFHLITKQTQEPSVVAQLVNAVIKAIEKEGIDTDLSVVIPAAVPARAVNEFLAKETLARLREKSVLVGSIAGGIEVKLHKERITLDITATTLKELVAQYLRKDFREMLYHSGT